MDKSTVPLKADCWICFNNEKNITLTKLECKQMLKNCKTYLDNSIIFNSFESETNMSCCSYCYESARQLTMLEEQVKNLQKEISDFSLLFSKTVLERRSLIENEIDISAKKLTPQIEKCFTNQKNPVITISGADRDSNVDLQNAIVKEEINEIVSNELQSDSPRTAEIKDLAAFSWFDADERENITEDEFENVFHSNDEIEVKCSENETFSKADDDVHKEKVPDSQMSTTITRGFNKWNTMPIFDYPKHVENKINHNQLENFLPDGIRNSTEIVADAAVGNAECTKVFDDPSKPINCSNTFSKELPEKEMVVKVMEMIEMIENNPYKCLICGQRLNSKPNLQSHSKELHNKDRPYNCPFCEKSFLLRYHLKIHLRSHTGKRPYKCSICSKSFFEAQNLKVHEKAHEKVHSEERPHKCSFCPKSFAIASGLRSHERMHTGERPYKCSFCEKSFTIPKFLKVHEMRHSAEKPFNCSICSKSFSRLCDLKKHEKHHSAEKRYKCYSCSKSFVNASDLKKHQDSHSDEKQHQCSFCEKSFKHVSNLKDHEKTHAGHSKPKPYKCSICEKSFLNPSALKIHERSHTGEKPFTCSTCSKSFTNSSALERHKLYHSEQKPYKCPSCSKSFRSPSNLKTHQETHSEERPHKCSLCEKSFKRPAKLKRHERIHSGERPYKCSLCPNTFRYLEDAKRHEELHTGQTGYKCPICPKMFTFSEYLKNHLKRKHGGTQEEFILP